MADSLGLQFVASICKSGDSRFLVDHPVDAAWLFDEGRAAFTFLGNYFREFGHYPSLELVEQELGKKIETVDAEPLYLRGKLVNRTASTQLHSSLTKSIELLEKGQSQEAARLLQEKSASILRLGDHGSVTKLRNDSTKRLQQYKDEIDKKDLIGIPTKWPSLNDAINCWENGRLNVISAMSNTGKALHVDEPVFTPSGWRRIGNIQVGDLVYSDDGLPTEVSGVFPQGQKQLYAVTFSDDTVVECCGEHLWTVNNYQAETLARPNWKVHTTESLINRFKNKSAPRLQIPQTKWVEMPAKQLRIDPYLMGYFLGDGCSRGHQISITIGERDRDHAQYLGTKLPVGCRFSKYRICYTIRADGKKGGNEFINGLNYYGLRGKGSHDKFIPDDYKFGHVIDRIAVLQGLLDSDGWVERCGSIFFGSESDALCDDIKFIVESLGGTCRRIGYNRLSIFLPSRIMPFRLHRKADIARRRKKIFEPHRNIVKIEESRVGEAVCISVKNPSCHYLTKNFVVTHNSWWTLVAANHAEQVQKKSVLYVTMEMSKRAIFRRLDAIRLKIPFSAFRRANFDSDLRQDLENGLLALSVNESTTDIHVADKSIVKTVADVARLTAAIQPEIVFIDGGYLLSSEKQGAWEGTVDVVKQLQSEAEASDIPWVVTTQMGDSNETGKSRKENQKNPWNVRYGKEWFINPDILIQLYQNEDLRLTNRMQIDLLKIRDADMSPNSFFIRWNLEEMNFEEIRDDEPATEQMSF